MSDSTIKLIVGLGNPGPRYQQTRHNAGFWFIDELALAFHAHPLSESRFHGDACKTRIGGQDVWLLKPDTFMNLSGQAISAISRFYKIPVEQILVVHDELDLPPGTARLKRGGGHGGHNGLRDTIEKMGSKDFARLRIGIGHPGDKSRVHDYVLHPATRDEQIEMDTSISRAVNVIEDVVNGEWDRAMNKLHSQ